MKKIILAIFAVLAFNTAWAISAGGHAVAAHVAIGAHPVAAPHISAPAPAPVVAPKATVVSTTPAASVVKSPVTAPKVPESNTTIVPSARAPIVASRSCERDKDNNCKQ